MSVRKVTCPISVKEWKLWGRLLEQILLPVTRFQTISTIEPKRLHFPASYQDFAVQLRSVLLLR